MINIAICDDDLEYIDDVERHISQYFAENGLTFNLFKSQNGNDLLNCEHDFDIAFLDIEMPQIDGIRLAGSCWQKIPIWF